MTMKFPARLLIALMIAAPFCSAQSSSSSASSGSSGGSGTSGLGFSIETEMLTYKSLEANSEAIACDIARRLYNSDLGPPTATAPCTIQTGSSSGIGVVIVPSDSTVSTDFQLWRADMASMNSLIVNGNKLCTAPPSGGEQSRGAPAAAAAAASSLAGLTPAGQSLSLAQGVIGMFASNESETPVTGTIHDEALVDGVARQLKALGIAVLVPDVYGPFGLGGVDTTSSPYLSNLSKLTDTRSCLQARKDAMPKSQQEADPISGAIASIDVFLGKVLGGAPAPSTASAATPAAGTRPPASATTTTPAASTPAPTEAVPHLVSVLKADGLARAIGVGLDGTVAPTSPWQHILWLKALESGGSVAKSGNIMGSKTRYSGGAVSTYSLFNFDGNLGLLGKCVRLRRVCAHEKFLESVSRDR